MQFFLKALPWLVVIAALCLPGYAARENWGSTDAGIAVIAAIGILIFTGWALIFYGRQSEIGTLAQAGYFLRELGRSSYLTLIAAMLGTFCALAVLFTAIVSSPLDPKLNQSHAVTALPVEKPAESADRSIANQVHSEEVPATTPIARKAGIGDVRAANKPNWHAQFPSAIEAFLGGFATILAVGFFYRRLAPYTDMWELLGEISNDVNRLSEKTSKSNNIWWAYPGFALGRFRSLNENGTPNTENSLYEAFKSVLYTAFGKDNVNIHAIVYNKECLESFYLAYSFQASNDYASFAATNGNVDINALATQLTNHTKTKRVSACLQSEVDLIDVCKTSSGVKGKLYQATKPDAMPPFMIVIGSVVYQISNFGSPIFVPCEPEDAWAACYKKICGVFWPAAGRNASHLLQLVAYRRDDAAFAKAVTNHIKCHIDAAVSAGVAKAM